MTAVLLSPEEARVLGCLMEKAATTPDNYPLSVNALLNACNQTTNRDPVVSFDEATVERALHGLRTKDLSRRVRATGQRVVKHRHVVDETLQLTVPEFALLGLLLLRGGQTAGALKQRAERWHSFRSLEDVDATLARLQERGFAVRLERQPGQKEARWQSSIVADDAHPPEAPPSTEAVAPVPSFEQAPVAPRTLDVRNPATGELVRSVAVTEGTEIAQKVARARRSQPEWARRTYDERAATLRAFRSLLAEEGDAFAAVTTSEMGKPIRQARAEVEAVLDRIDWNLDHVASVLAPLTVTAPAPGTTGERITHEPVGVVAHVSAWNYPYFVGLNSIVPALLTGNAVLYKPSEYATLTGLRLIDALHRAGVPVDVIQLVVGGGSAGAALVNADIDMVCFTGSYPTGRRVAAAAAERLVRVQLELGGKDGAYVADDVDIESAALGVAEGAFYNAGQSCSALERVYVHEAIYNRFVDAFVEAVAAYRVGDPNEPATDVGPLTRPGQLDVLDAQVADAVQRGAKILCGGRRIDRPGNWFELTVLVDVDREMLLMQEETFGPVIGVQRVRDDAEATVALADTHSGLGAAVFSADRERALRILAGLDTGNAYWNTSDRSSVRLPWAGRRQSGLGVSMSESGIRALLREKAWHEAAG